MVLRMTRLTDDGGETSGNVPRPRSYSGNDDAYNGLRKNVASCSDDIRHMTDERSARIHRGRRAVRRRPNYTNLQSPYTSDETNLRIPSNRLFKRNQRREVGKPPAGDIGTIGVFPGGRTDMEGVVDTNDQRISKCHLF
ncbi:unnamed protein product [Protopolystoma xenopodis]|uniref:Uncharacterized protein n=1 Tax=Protopolystoma xenopodis TaxID=117903 RepID=A0A3S5CHN2_9PLAT|nr:unnamed protein product [Protopolystoma xenopodis]